jgi:threonine/homoserine/homoserine lactone efflux protein
MHIFNCIWQGLTTGMVLSLMLGTVFFSLIRNSLKYGYYSGVYISLGVIVCDIMFISLAIASHGFAVFLKEYEMSISLTGGIVLMLMGLFMIIKAKPEVKEGKDLAPVKNSPYYYFANGFLLNVLNPVNFFSWLGISSMLTIKYDYDITDKVIFFSSSLVSIFIVEILIAHSATRLKNLVTPLVLKRINQISGTIFLLLGLRLALGFFF